VPVVGIKKGKIVEEIKFIFLVAIVVGSCGVRETFRVGLRIFERNVTRKITI
jgi:hypothetical protein